MRRLGWPAAIALLAYRVGWTQGARRMQSTMLGTHESALESFAHSLRDVGVWPEREQPARPEKVGMTAEEFAKKLEALAAKRDKNERPDGSYL